MIQTQTQLSQFLDLIKHETELAIDTEFKRVNTYYPVLCLVQIATKSATDCIDILAIEDLNPLFEKLYQKDCLWIVHSARQDIEAMYYLSKQLPKCLFDTQIAASLLGHPMQISYQALTQILQNVYLEKAYTRLDWTTRPLPDEALEYALDDVRYLLKNFYQLESQLKTEHKSHWIEQEGQLLLDIKLYNPDIKNAWKNVKGFSRLAKNTRCLIAQLAAFREHQAIHKNKPRKWIMSDDKLINYVLKKESLPFGIKTVFNEFLVSNEQLNKAEIIINNKHTLPTKTEKAKKNELQKLIKNIANQYNLDDKIIANGKSLLSFIRGDRSVIFLTGWRFNLLKEELEKCKIV
ncbi:ribonuclease D [Isorropodon fossajaponicum endosymbiont JTNG4]|uniref:ribonuclease D n=1 Tax=Isorropodon fossajaponicum symbiont TaxID=883811 RepID=UPI0019162539|nr:ribonuclease D [Isorropodon fossajaponicum symbiont]BBB24301.1 ribonuclease D [Isorropodon fossajaponicum endosymbiont JTNG4]